MDLVQATVAHKAFGEGVVTAQTDDTLTVQFKETNAEKKFAFPDAFENFLTCDNPEKKAEIAKALTEAKHRRMHAAAELNRERTARQARLVEEMHATTSAKGTPRKKTAKSGAKAEKKAPAKKKTAKTVDSVETVE